MTRSSAIGDCVYIFQIEPDVFKIGTSVNYGHRFWELSRRFHGLEFVQAWFMPDSSFVEGIAHKLLRGSRYHKYGGNEIFKCSKNKAIRTVRQAIKDKTLIEAKLGGSYSDDQIKYALKKAGSVNGAKELLGCAKNTILRRQKMWAEGKKLKHKVVK